jgi:hypothetical protein
MFLSKELRNFAVVVHFFRDEPIAVSEELFNFATAEVFQNGKLLKRRKQKSFPKWKTF